MTTLAVYAGHESKNVKAFENWLGKPVEAVHAITGGQTWEAADPSWQLNVQENLGGTGRPIIWSIPMTPDNGGAAAFREAATGARNGMYKEWAQDILASRAGDTEPIYVRTTWELGGEWFPWTKAAQEDPGAYKGAFQQFAQSFHDVSPRFKMVWDFNGDRGDPRPLYPGDKAVDVIGQSMYYQPAYVGTDPVKAFEHARSGYPYGLDWMAQFAAERGKPMAIAEWGVPGNADHGGAQWAKLFDQWVDGNNVALTSYWNAGDGSGYHGTVSDNDPAASAAALRQIFLSDTPDAAAAATPAPPAPAVAPVVPAASPASMATAIPAPASVAVPTVAPAAAPVVASGPSPVTAPPVAPAPAMPPSPSPAAAPVAPDGMFDPNAYYAANGVTPQQLAAYDQSVAALTPAGGFTTPAASSGAGFDQTMYWRENGVSPEELATYNRNPTDAIRPNSDGTFEFFGMPVRLKAFEDFQSGNGIFTNLWGRSHVNETEGAVAVADGSVEKSGVMDPADGAGGGFGYGIHMFLGTLTPGDRPGPYIALWPSTDRWPGPEIDLVEINANKEGYATLHWAANGQNGEGGKGNDAYQSISLKGVDLTQPHFYWADWQPDGVTIGVDDKVYGTFAEHVPKSFAEGGENLSPGIGVLTDWVRQYQQEGVDVATSLQGWAFLEHADAAAAAVPVASAPGAPAALADISALG